MTADSLVPCPSVPRAPSQDTGVGVPRSLHRGSPTAIVGSSLFVSSSYICLKSLPGRPGPLCHHLRRRIMLCKSREGPLAIPRTLLPRGGAEAEAERPGQAPDADHQARPPGPTDRLQTVMHASDTGTPSHTLAPTKHHPHQHDQQSR